MKVFIDNTEVQQEDYSYNSFTGIITFKFKPEKYYTKKRKWWQFWKPKYGRYVQIQFKK